MKKSIEFPRQKSFRMPDVLHPFQHRLNLGTLDMIQIAFMSVTIAPLRLLLVGLLLLAVWPLAAIAMAFRTEEDRKKPMTGWRWMYMQVVRIAARMGAFLAGFHCVKITGKQASSQDAPIAVVAPHSGLFDGIVLVAGHRDLPSLCCKDALADIPFVGRLILFSQPVLVKREDPNSRTNTIREIQRRSHSGGQWPQIFIFPEGTCSNRTCLITFKPGAFIPGVPVQPVCLRYHNRLDTVTWTWDGPSAFQCLWYTLCQFQTNLEIEYMPIYKPTEEEMGDAKLFANNVRAVMADRLDLPVTHHTYDDCRLMLKASQLQLPMETGLIEFEKLHKKLGVDFEQMKVLLEKYQKIANSTGVITLAEFAAYLQLPVSPALKQVFALYDRNRTGKINFREYVIGLALVSGPANTEETLKLAFELFDVDKKGHVCQEGLLAILHNAFGMTEEEVDDLFVHADMDGDGKITFEDFKLYAQEKPEYAKLFTTYHSMRNNATNGHAVQCENPDTVLRGKWKEE